MRNKACVSCIVVVIKYVQIRVTKHAKRAVLACCERAITFVPVFPWRVIFGENYSVIYRGHLKFYIKKVCKQYNLTFHRS